MNTRFNPTANGRLHLGHLYLVLLNYHAARQCGGRFIVRFDDDQPYWVDALGRQRMGEFCEAIKEDLGWMGLTPDLYSYESRERAANEEFVRGLRLLERGEDLGFPMPQITFCDRAYPYVPYLTAVKVAQDHREGCDCIIRGEDLVTEFALYCYFCRLLDVPIPKFYYVPKLTHEGADLTDLSKTAGNFRIADFRCRGYSPADILRLLERSCLREPEKGWCFGNIRRCPTLNL